MIIDSHTHYAHARYDKEFPYLCPADGEYSIGRADRESLISEMRKSGITGFIEPSIGFDAIEKQLELVKSHENFMWSALGVHPTRCIHTSWKKRKKLLEYAEKYPVVAIGETGLDYHLTRREQRRFWQKIWFTYQIKLADKLKLPLVLHVRGADADALKILKRYKNRLHGGVVHCFGGNYECAKEYIALGFAIGIGGKLLAGDSEATELSDTVKKAPLYSLLLETDAPFVFPDMKGLKCGSNQRKKLCNSSLILPLVLRKIAFLRGEDKQTVEDIIYENTLRLFNLQGNEIETRLRKK
ncbi:MAG: TatD family hydrolase [Clostridia bacterium]|nr:TatD family hydrolase [Clostridia bacterium]